MEGINKVVTIALIVGILYVLYRYQDVFMSLISNNNEMNRLKSEPLPAIENNLDNISRFSIPSLDNEDGRSFDDNSFMSSLASSSFDIDDLESNFTNNSLQF